MNGDVYIMFGSADQGRTAAKQLNGRHYNCKMLAVAYVLILLMNGVDTLILVNIFISSLKPVREPLR